jgi:hypothetical protein
LFDLLTAAGLKNTAVGYYAGIEVTTGEYNTAVGW